MVEGALRRDLGDLALDRDPAERIVAIEHENGDAGVVPEVLQLGAEVVQVQDDVLVVPVHPDRSLVRLPVLTQRSDDGKVRLLVQERRLAFGQCRHRG